MRRFVSATLVAVLLAGAGLRASNSCQEQYDAAIHEADGMWSNCSGISWANTILVCTPLYLAAVVSASGNLEQCLGAPLIIGG